MKPLRIYEWVSDPWNKESSNKTKTPILPFHLLFHLLSLIFVVSLWQSHLPIDLAQLIKQFKSTIWTHFNSTLTNLNLNSYKHPVRNRPIINASCIDGPNSVTDRSPVDEGQGQARVQGDRVTVAPKPSKFLRFGDDGGGVIVTLGLNWHCLTGVRLWERIDNGNQ